MKGGVMADNKCEFDGEEVIPLGGNACVLHGRCPTGLPRSPARSSANVVRMGACDPSIA